MVRNFHLRAGALAACAVVLASVGCNQYGPVSRPAYDYATALYSVSNRKAADRLDDVSARIRASQAGGEISSDEAAWLEAIVAQSRDGDWDAAAASSRTMMQEQVQR